jgi:lactate permease
LIVPAYLILVMGGWKALKGVIPGAAICGIAFAGTQFGVSNFVGPEATDILSSLAAIGALVVLFRIWQPKDSFQLQESGTSEQVTRHHPAGKVMLAWAPYALLVLFVLAWSWTPVKTALNTQTIMLDWPGLHNQIIRTTPVVPTPAPYPAPYRLDWLAASGTSCMFTAILSAFILGLSPARFIGVLGSTLKRLAFSLLTIASVLALAFLMNYSGATVTLGLLFAATGALFPFFSAMLGWLGVFLTGSDTAANALFGNLQVVTAQRLGLDPVLMAASNSSGGVMGKMISLQSIAVAAGATGMPSKDEARLFRFTLKHSMLLAAVIALIVAFYSAWIG